MRYWLIPCLAAFLLHSTPSKLSGGGLAGYRLATADQTRLTASTAGYTLEVELKPYRLVLRRGGEIIARNPSGGGAVFYRKGSALKLEAVTGWLDTGDGLSLTVVTSAPAFQAQVRLTLFIDNVLVRYATGDEQNCERIEESYELAASGHWYGGNVTSGHHWPLETAALELDPFLATSNQTTPFWLTSAGAGFYVPTWQPMGFSIAKGGDGLFRFNLKDTPALEYRLIAGGDIVQVYDAFVCLAGKPSTTPPQGYFARPIFNTWIEFRTAVNQPGVLEYAGTLRDKGFGCDVFMIDDMWQTHYGDHEFNRKKFPDPRAMVDRMHEKGFKMILWEVPFVDFDAENFEMLKKKGYLVLDEVGRKPAGIRWWNGTSALVDLSNPAAYAWFIGQLKGLQERYGIDGFKLDAGDAEYFDPGFQSWGSVTPNRYTDLFASVGSHFQINELRVSWLVQERGLVERLRDKSNSWNERTGLGSLIPHGLTESLIGYGYFCPDIIGGGLSGDFEKADFKGMDPELFVRWTQASALMPMMQFSYAPWNLDDQSVQICLRYARLHEELGSYIYRLALDMRRTGRPIIRPLFFRNPEDERTYAIDDQFLLGERLLVAPVLEKGAAARDVYLPAGTWKDFWSGEIYQGGRVLTGYPAPLDKLPVFVSID